MRRLFNPYKLKRQWGKGIQKAADFVSLGNDKVSYRDFAWHEKKVNPFIENEGRRWRNKIKIYGLIASLFLFIIIIVFHPFFQIRKISLIGLQRIPESEFRANVEGIINCRHWLILPGKNYFLVDTGELNSILKEKFPLETIVIKKIFPHNLEIQIEEKISTIIYDNGKKYYYLDANGKILEILRQASENEQLDAESVKKEMGDYPIIYEKDGSSGSVNDQILDKNTAFGIIQWFNLINKRTSLRLEYITMEGGKAGEGLIKTRRELEIKVRLDKDVENQFAKLQYLLKEKQNLNYIDLRFLDRVYWR